MTRDFILDHAYGFLIVLARTGAIFALLPGLGETSIPTTIKAGMILTLSLLLAPVIEPLLPPRPENEIALGLMIVIETVNGLWFGWLARVITTSLPLAGQFIADHAGFSNVLMPSPDLGSQTSAVARLYEIAVPVLIFSTGLYQPALAALVGFYQLIRPGTLVWAGDSAAVTISAVMESFDLALRLASPFILASVAWQVTIGLIARLVPRMQIYFVAMPGQILVGIALLALLAAPLLGAWSNAVHDGFAQLPGGR